MTRKFYKKQIEKIIDGMSVKNLRKLYYLLIGFTGGIEQEKENEQWRI